MKPETKLSRYNYIYDAVKKEDAETIVYILRQIRSKTLRSLIRFNLLRIDEPLFFTKKKIKELSAELHMSVRKVREYILASSLLSAVIKLEGEKLLNAIKK